jgi:16S rRNA (uracil1498-N3)-methyltransferase
VTAPRFFVDTALSPGAEGTLTPEQSRKVRSVLRLSAGSRLLLCDGTGKEAVARVVSLHGTSVVWHADEVEEPDREPPLDLTVGLALLRGERFDLAVQKLTELGVRRIVPLRADRCVVSLEVARAIQTRVDRYRRIGREAAEQAERVTLPVIDLPQTLDTFLSDWPVTVLVERTDASPLSQLQVGEAFALAIGPEGGWSDRELTRIAANAHGTASLGRLILRAETAAIVAAGALVQQSWARTTTTT